MNKNRRALVMLHGATGSASQLKPLEDELSSYFEIMNYDLPGHGTRSTEEGVFSIPAFADDIASKLKADNITRAIFFGYSMGGYVAMYLSRKYPELAEAVITLATKFYWDREGALKESEKVNPELISEKFPAFAADLKQRHQPGDWETVLRNTREMMVELGESNCLQLHDYADIKIPCMVMLGDRDKMVSLEETVSVFKNLPNGRMAILPATPHPFEKADISMLSFHIRIFSNGLT